MIKRKSKIKKKVLKKTQKQIIFEYLATVGASFLIALVFTLLLTLHARNEMIKNLYVNKLEQQQYNEQVAMKIVAQTDLMKDLSKRNYAVCMHVGDVYELAHDYEKAQYAYEIALKKSRYGTYHCYYKLARVLIAQEKFEDAKKCINSVKDLKDKSLIKYKTRVHIEMGDKYYSIGKFLSAAKSYEKAKYYYDKFSKKDEKIADSITERIIQAYIKTADFMVKSGYNAKAVEFLRKAENFSNDNFLIQYKLAIIYSDLDPIKSIEYFEPLLRKQPQNIDYGVYTGALMKAANIMDLKGNHVKAKYYRYKIRSIDFFINQKVVYANDVEILLEKFSVRKIWLRYRLRGFYRIKNLSYVDFTNLYGDFVLRKGNKILEQISINCVSKSNILYAGGDISNQIPVNFTKNIYTKKELEQYYIDIYLYKDERYKTLVHTMKVPVKTIVQNTDF